MRHIITALLLSITTLLFADTTRIYTLKINQEINSASWLYTRQALNEAKKTDAQLVILHLNTYGGEVVYADSMRTAIMYSPIPVVAFVDNNAASAGALISIACRRIYMRPGASIGAATVVNSADGQAMPDKYQSYMRATMRATAEYHGKDANGEWIRNPLIAEAMVDDRIAIPGVIDSGKTLTFTTKEAIAHRYCEAEADSISQIIRHEGYNPDQCIITQYEPTITDKAKGWLLGTMLRSILIMIIVGGIYFELQQPGLGFPSIAAVIAAILYFAPLYIEGLAAYWEIILFVVSIILIILEIFVTPGFGILGIAGIILLITSLLFASLGNTYFDFTTIAIPDLSHSLTTILLGLILSFIAIIWLTSKIGSKGIFAKLALTASQPDADGYVGVDTHINTLVGSTATVVTDLKPTGKIACNNTTYEATSIYGTYIPRHSTVEIIKTESGRCYVKLPDE